MCIPGLLQRHALRPRPDLASPIIGERQGQGCPAFFRETRHRSSGWVRTVSASACSRPGLLLLRHTKADHVRPSYIDLESIYFVTVLLSELSHSITPERSRPCLERRGDPGLVGGNMGSQAPLPRKDTGSSAALPMA
jgi:hypothetical protein